MTLSEAYEIQRKENIALRREVSTLRASVYTIKDKEAQDKEIRRLTRALASTEKDRDHYKDLYEREKLRRENLELEKEAQNSAQASARIRQLEQTIIQNRSTYNAALVERDQLKEKLEAANSIIKRLQSQLNRNHENSSIPSSKERFPSKIKNSREKTGRRPGAQKGHAAHRRPHLDPTVPVVNIPAPENIISDPDYYPTGKVITKQVLDISVSVSVTEYRTPEYRNRKTGSRIHAPFPDGVVNEFNYGPNTKALAFLLNNYCNVSIDKTSEFLYGISNGSVLLSKGFINSLSHQFSVRTKEDRERIFHRLLEAPCMHTDITPGRVNGKTVQVFVCANKDEVLYLARDHKGLAGVVGTPVEEYGQILVHDHDTTFYHYGREHQECLAHILRYLKDSIENEPDLVWNKQMHQFLTETIHTVKSRRGSLSEKEITGFEERYDEILRQAAKDYFYHPPDDSYPNGKNLYERMEKYRDAHLLFLRNPDVDYTNNLAERDLRKIKRKQHQVVAFRSRKSISDLADCMSIIETDRIYNANIFAAAREVFARQTPVPQQ